MAGGCVRSLATAAGVTLPNPVTDTRIDERQHHRAGTRTPVLAPFAHRMTGRGVQGATVLVCTLLHRMEQRSARRSHRERRTLVMNAPCVASFAIQMGMYNSLPFPLRLPPRLHLPCREHREAMNKSHVYMLFLINRRRSGLPQTSSQVRRLPLLSWIFLRSLVSSAQDDEPEGG